MAFDDCIGIWQSIQFLLVLPLFSPFLKASMYCRACTEDWWQAIHFKINKATPPFDIIVCTMTTATGKITFLITATHLEKLKLLAVHIRFRPVRLKIRKIKIGQGIARNKCKQRRFGGTVIAGMAHTSNILLSLPGQRCNTCDEHGFF